MLTAYMKRKISRFARGSLYRMNAKTADCYAFTLTKDGKDWDGGWDWSKNLVDKTAQYLYMLYPPKFIKLGV